jgi:hypothetical protein
MNAALMLEMPQIITDISTWVLNASPIILMIVGVLLVIFADAAKWVIRLFGAGIFIWGLISALQLLG